MCHFKKHSQNGELFKGFSLKCETKVGSLLHRADFYEARTEKSPR